jgi:hypothetical protein
LSIASPLCAIRLTVVSQVPGQGASQQTGNTPAAPPEAANTGAPAAKATLADITYEQIKPSESFVEFEQSKFAIGYPANWKATGEGSSFRIVPAEGASEEVIAYGVVISIAPSSGSLNEATEALVETLQKSNPGMHALDAPRKIRVGAMRGRAVNLVGNSPVQRNGQSLAEHDWLVTLPRPDGDMLYLVFIAPEADFSQLRSTYQKMLGSVQVK